MASCIIFEKDLKKLGKKLMKSFHNQIHNEYLLNEFEEVKLKRKFYDENIVRLYKSFFSHYHAIEAHLDDLVVEDLDKKIKDETLNYKFINKFFEQMDLKLKINKNIDYELDEDLCSMKKSFQNIYEVFHHEYVDLED